MNFFRNAFSHPKTTFVGLLAGIAQVATAIAISPGRVGIYAGGISGIATALLGIFAADAKVKAASRFHSIEGREDMGTQSNPLGGQVLVDGLAVLSALQAVLSQLHVIMDPGTNYDAKVQAAEAIAVAGLNTYAKLRGIQDFDASAVGADVQALVESGVKLLNDLDKVTGMKPIA